MKLLLKARADTDSTNNEGRTPLHIAAYWGNVECVQLLLEVAADPNTTDESGNTPLSDAENRGHKEVLRLLKEELAWYPEKLQLIKDRVKAASKNGDGVISKAELGQLMRRLDPMFSEHHFSQLLARSDAHEDGKVRFGDFIDWIFNEPKVATQRSD